MICTVCLKVIASLATEWRILPNGALTSHHTTYASLKTSIDQGCYSCNALWQALKPNEQTRISESFAGSRPDSDADTTRLDLQRYNATSSSISTGPSSGYDPEYGFWSLGFKAQEFWHTEVSLILQPLDDGMRDLVPRLQKSMLHRTDEN